MVPVTSESNLIGNSAVESAVIHKKTITESIKLSQVVFIEKINSYMKFSITFLLLVVFGSFSLNAQTHSAHDPGIVFNDNIKWKEALQMAKKENKVIFVDAYTTWCGPCKMMDKRVFTDPTVGEFFNANFIPVKMDMEKGEGIELAQKYTVRAYPSFLFVDSRGEVVHRGVGYQAPEMFLKLGAAALDGENSLQGMERRYASGERSPEFLYMYTEARAGVLDGSHQPIAAEYLATQNDLSTRANLEFLYRYTENTEGKMFEDFMKQRANMEEAFGERAIQQKTEMMMQQTLYGENPPSEAEARSLFMKLDPENVEQSMAKYQMNQFRMQDDYAGYADAAKKYYKKYPARDANELNNAAWSIYEASDDKKTLKRGLKLGLQSTALSMDSYNADTVAALYYKLGKKKKAMEWADKAIALAEESGDDATGTKELLEKIRML